MKPGSALVVLAARGRFKLGMRLIGGPTPPERLDLLVEGDTVRAGHVADDSLAVRDVRAHAKGHTLWISMPDSVLKGRTRCMVGAAGGSAKVTVWRDARI